MKFSTNYRYDNRKEKAKYVWLKYRPILKGKILDVGAAEGYLSQYVPKDNKYIQIGLEPNNEIQANLENILPLKKNQYNCVLCLDVLEHIENLYQLFDELCRVTKKYLIISLPNPWVDFMLTLKNGYYKENRPLKYYFLPVEPPKDRHRWFYSPTEVIKLIQYRARKNKMIIIQIDKMENNSLKTRIYKWVIKFFIHKSIPIDDLFVNNIWAVLEKRGNKS